MKYFRLSLLMIITALLLFLLAGERVIEKDKTGEVKKEEMIHESYIKLDDFALKLDSQQWAEAQAEQFKQAFKN